MNTVIQFWNEHRVEIIAVAVWLMSGVLNILIRFKTAEQWVAFGERHPKIQNLIRALRALGLDPVKLLQALIALVNKKAVETKDDRPLRLKESGKDSDEKPEDKPESTKEPEKKA